MTPKYFAQIKFQTIIVEEKNILIPIYDDLEYEHEIIAASENAAIDYYKTIRENPGELSLSKIAITHQLKGYMKTTEGGKIISESFQPIKE